MVMPSPLQPHSSASPLRLVLTSIKGEMMETIFMGMISIKYQLTWEPQPGVQCVKGKCTSHFHKARLSGKEGLRFALIMPGFGVALVVFNQTTQIDLTQMYNPVCLHCFPTFPRRRLGVREVQKPWPISEGLFGSKGRESIAPQPPGNSLPASP